MGGGAGSGGVAGPGMIPIRWQLLKSSVSRNAAGSAVPAASIRTMKTWRQPWQQNRQVSSEAVWAMGFRGRGRPQRSQPACGVVIAKEVNLSR